MKKLIMGIDGGGTKSHIALFNIEGKCVSFTTWGALNHEVLEGSFGQLEGELKNSIGAALKNAEAVFENIEHAVIGLAGVDTREQYRFISEMLRNLGLKDFTLCNDGYLGVAAGCPEGAGICAINGTGSVLTAIDYSGIMKQVGGIWGITDDCGGSGWYGEQVIKAVYRELYKCGTPTIMKQMVFNYLKIEHKDDYVEAVTSALEKEPLQYTEFNRYVFTAAEAGDAAALKILEMSAEHYADSIIWFARKLDFPMHKPLYVTLAGSVFVKQKVKILPKLIEERVRLNLEARKVSFSCLEASPVLGAVMWALRKTGVKTGSNLQEKIQYNIKEFTK